MSSPAQSSESLATALMSSQQTARRALAVVGLVGIALIHLLDVEEKFEEVAYIGALFVGLIVVSLVLAEALMRGDDRRIWILTGLIAAATMLAYSISRSVGLPGEHGEEVGKWTEPLGLASLLVEGVVVWVVVSRLLVAQNSD
jgi:hypothetical protein